MKKAKGVILSENMTSYSSLNSTVTGFGPRDFLCSNQLPLTICIHISVLINIK